LGGAGGVMALRISERMPLSPACRHPATLAIPSRDHRQTMGTKCKIGFQQREGELPGWQVYTELFEPEDVVYLELEGVQANVAMFADMEADGGTVTLRLPAATARQLGRVPPDWKKDTR
jgi:hypothetical protein